MRVVAIIQARMGSTRLPGKILMELGGHTMLRQIVTRASRSRLVHLVVVAVPKADFPAITGKRADFLLWPCDGDENDLIARYLEVAQQFNADIIVRLCADNPFVEPAEIDRAISYYLHYPCIYVSNMHQHDIYAMHPMERRYNGYPDGIGCEVFSFSRLQWMYQAIEEPLYREHPHQYFHREALISSPDCPKEFANPLLKLDVNNLPDYEFAKDIYDALYPKSPRFHITDVIKYLDEKNKR